jgi:hypothetical protein
VRDEIEALQKRWQGEARFRGLHASMRLAREGVVLGAETVLARRLDDGSLESKVARVLTLLSVAYAQYMRLRINPNQPTPDGFTYVLPKPGGDVVHFDDCQQEPGTVNESGTYNVPGSMIEFKGLRYAKLLQSDIIKQYLTEDWTKQGTSQIEAAQGRQVIWYFAEPSALEVARSLFGKSDQLRKIRLELG